MVIKKGEIFNIPNILTYIRILCVPAFIITFFAIPASSFVNIYVSLAIFLFASITDVVDGKIARKYNQTSDIGGVLDPLADKLLQVSVIICLTVNGNIHWIFPVLIGAKEFYMILGSLFLVKKNIVGKANFFGKAAAFVFAVAILAAFFDGANGIMTGWLGADAGKIFSIVIIVIFSIGIALAYIAAFIYTKMVIDQIGGVKRLKDSENIKVDYSIKTKNKK